MKELSKNSSSNEIKKYFNVVLKLAKSNDQFPVDLDMVWPLVYGTKQKAVNELRNTKNEDGSEKYIEGIDYQSLNQKVEAGHTYTTVHKYKLSVPCMEWFVARKVRMVFDVYSQVFHKVADPTKLLSPQSTKARIMAAEFTFKTLRLSETSKAKFIEAINEPLGLPAVDYVPSEDAMFSATQLLEDRNLNISTRSFNKLMIQKGFLVELERKSRSKGVKRYKNLTEAGKKYGKNMNSPENPRETQPLYYKGKFDELLKELEIIFNK